MIEPRRSTFRSRLVPALVLSLAAGASLAACSAGSTPGGTSTGGSGHGGSTGTTSSSTTTTSTGPDDCATLCATETMACPKTSTACVLLCEINKAEVTWCKAIATAATDCLAKQPASSFQCDTNGQPSAMTGVCTTEIAAMNSCWDNGPPGGLPDQTPACTGVCNKEASLSCADPNCLTTCEADVKAGAKCNGAFAAYVTCAWEQPASSFACDTEKPPRANLKAGICVWEAALLAGCLQMP